MMKFPSNIFNDEEVRQWLDSVADDLSRDTLPKMRSSVFVLGLVEPEGVEPEGVEPEGVEPEGVDPYLLMQIGAALLLDKPLVLVSYRGAFIPARARKLADVVVEVDGLDAPADREKMRAALDQMILKLRREGRPV